MTGTGTPFVMSNWRAVVFALGLLTAGSARAREGELVTREGDWLIADRQTVKGSHLRVNGTVVIRQGGSLTLEDSTLEILGRFAREHQIQIETGGLLRTRRATLGGSANPGGAPFHTVIVLNGGTWEAEDTTVQYSYGVNCARDKPSRMRALRLKAGPRPDAVIVSGQADIELADSEFPLAITVSARLGGQARLDLPVRTPFTRSFDASQLPGVQFRLRLERFTVPGYWFVFVGDVNPAHPPLTLEFGDCPKFFACLLGHNVAGELTLSRDLAEPVRYGNLTLRRAAGCQPRVDMWNFYATGSATDLRVAGRGHIAELMQHGGVIHLAGEGDHGLSLGCTTLDLHQDARLDLENVHLGRPLSWTADGVRGEASIQGTARLTGRRIRIRDVDFHTRGEGSVDLEAVTGANTATRREEGGRVTFR